MIDGRHIGILLPISIFTYSLCVIIRMSIMLHPPAKFHRNRKKTSANFWRHIDFSRWRSWSRKSTSEFRFSDSFCSKWWKSVHTKFGWDTSIHCWNKTTYGLGKRTVAMLKFFLLFQFWPTCSHRHVILHQHAKFCLNQTMAGGVMT